MSEKYSNFWHGLLWSTSVVSTHLVPAQLCQIGECLLQMIHKQFFPVPIQHGLPKGESHWQQDQCQL